jgi:hypothetical protein
MSDHADEASKDIVSKFLDRFFRSSKEATKDPTGPTEEAREAADRELQEGEREASRTATDAAVKEARDGASKPRGLDPVTQWLVDQCNKAYNFLEKLWKRASRALGKKVAIAAGAAGGLMAISAAVEYGLPSNKAPIPAPQPSPVVVDIDIPPPLPAEIWDSPVDIAMVEDDFRLAASQFDARSLLDKLRIERFDLDTSDLPEPIVFVAAARASVAVTENNSTQTVQTTVGQLYQDWPEAQAEIEDAVSHNQGSDIHVDIDVGTEFATISIRG